MNEPTPTSDEPEGRRRRITVRQSVRTPGLTAPAIGRAVRAAAGARPIHAVNVTVTNDATMADLHARYLNDPKATDVLAFDLTGPGTPEEAIDGEIVVSADAAARMSTKLGVPARQEALRYVIHGVLHLCGGRDATPAQRRRMRRQEDRVLRELGWSLPASGTRRSTGGAGRSSRQGRS